MHRSSSAGAGVLRRSVALAVLAAAASVVVIPAPAAAQADPSGSVIGRVVDSNGDGVGGICVGVNPNGGGTGTDPDGNYEVAKIPPGTYTIQFNDCNQPSTYLSRWYLDRDGQDQADQVTIGDGDVVQLQPVTLHQGVAVSGRVTDSGGNGLEGVNVFVNPYDGSGPSSGARTDSDGAYRTGALPDGDYRVQIDDPADEFVTQYWNGRVLFDDADRLHVSLADDGNDHDGVDTQLTPGATIRGTVTDDADQPLADICVNANTPIPTGGWNGVGFGRTGVDGTYTLAALPPDLELRIQFQDCSPNPLHIEQWFDGAQAFESASPLHLSTGEARDGVDAHMATGIRVAGRVTDGSGNPLADIDIGVYPVDSGGSGFGRTDSNGDYTSSAVAPGSYRVQFRDNRSAPTWAAAYWDQQATFNSATILQLTAADLPQRIGIDARLGLAASISGTVTSEGGTPIGGICIDGATDTPSGPDGVGQARTDPDGSYTLTGLPAVAVKVRASDCQGVGPYASVWWQLADTYQAATPIELTAGQQRGGIDFALAPAATISGTVTDGAGQPVEGICVQAVTSAAFGALTGTQRDGSYTLVLSRAGTYTVQFIDCRQQPTLAGQSWSAPITLAAGGQRQGVDATLVPGGTSTVSGTVRNAAGVGVTDACVVVYLPNQYALFGQVAADGTFSVSGVPSGTFAVAFLGCGSSGQPTDVVRDPTDPSLTYQGQWWHGVDLSIAGTGEGGPDPIAQGATLVAVPAGAALTGFDQCFGCTPPPTTTTTTTTTTTAVATTTTSIAPTPAQVMITITRHTRAPGRATFTFDVTGVLAASDALVETVSFTARCTSTTGTVVESQGSASPLTVSGLDDRVTYSCVIVASEGGRTIGTSAVVIIEPLAAGTLPATGAASADTTWTALLVTLLGVLLVLAVRRPRRTRN